MKVFWRDLRSAIQLNDPERLRTAYDEFIKYKASILLAVINTPEIEVNSLATNSDILIDPNEPEYGYISISLLDSDRKLITTKVRNEDYTIKLDTSSLAATVTDVQSKPKLSNEQRVIFLLSDVSGSMSSTDPTRKRVAAAKKIVDALGPDDFLMLATFGMSHKPTFTSFHGSGTGGSKDCLDYLIDTNFSKAVGSTPLYASIGESIAMIDDLRQKLSGDQTPITYSIIVLTDGQNTYNGSSNDPELYKAISNPVVVAYLAKKLSIPVYTIGLSDGVDNNILKAIASSTNGLFGTTLSASGLDEIFSNYSRALEGQTFLKIKFNKNANSLRGRSARIIVSNKNNIKETNVNIR